MPTSYVLSNTLSLLKLFPSFSKRYETTKKLSCIIFPELLPMLHLQC